MSWKRRWVPVHPGDCGAGRPPLPPYCLPRALSRLFLMASRKSVVFTKCSLSFTLWGHREGLEGSRGQGSPCPPPTADSRQPGWEGQSRGGQHSPGCRTWPLPGRRHGPTPQAVNRCPESPGTVWRPAAAPHGQPAFVAGGCPTPPHEPHVLGETVDAAGEVLRHRPALHGFDTDLLQRLSKPGDGSVTHSSSETSTPLLRTPPWLGPGWLAPG